MTDTFDQRVDDGSALAEWAARVGIIVPEILPPGVSRADYLEQASGHWMHKSAEAAAREALKAQAFGEDDDGPMFSTFDGFDAVPPKPDWVIPGMVARGTAVSFAGPSGCGKSLWLLWQMLTLSRAGRRVAYFDWENGEPEIYDRLHTMGVTAEELRQGNFMLACFPNLPPLDSEAGGQKMCALTQQHGIDVIGLDTLSSTTAGAENDNDTGIAFYRCTGVPLRRSGVTVLILDHTGKDPSKGARGNSAKVGKWDGQYLVTGQVSPSGGALTFDSEGGKARSRHHQARTTWALETTPMVRFREQPPGSQWLIADGKVARHAQIIAAAKANGISPALTRDRFARSIRALGLRLDNGEVGELKRLLEVESNDES